MWNDANMITSFPNFYCAIHADAHKHHIKQIVHLTYARPMLCIYSIRLTLPYIVCPFSQNWPNFSRKLILEGPMATTPMVVSMKEVIGFIGIKRLVSGLHLVKHCETSGTQTAEKEPLPSASMSCMGHHQASLGWVDSQWFPLPHDFSDRCHGKSWQSSAWSGCVQCLSSLTFLWQWAVGTGQVEIHLKISQMPGDFRRTKGLNGFWRFQHSLAQLSVSRDHFLLLLSHVRQWPWHVKSS